MRNVSPRIVLCNGADLPQQLAQYEPLILEYSGDANNAQISNFLYPVLSVVLVIFQIVFLIYWRLLPMSFVQIG